MTRGASTGIALGSAGGQGDKGIGTRLREIRGGRSREKFGKLLNGTHRNTIDRYEKGKREHVPPEFLRLVIEKNPEWSLLWLQTGHGDKHEPASTVHVQKQPILEQPAPVPYGESAIDDQLLAQVLREIETAFGNLSAKVTVEKRAALIVAIYEDARSRGKVSREAVTRLMKLASFP